MWAWRIDVQKALMACSRTYAAILLLRLTKQQKSQGNSFTSIARYVSRETRMHMTTEECESHFNLAVVMFLNELDDRRIPDHYDDMHVFGESSSSSYRAHAA